MGSLVATPDVATGTIRIDVDQTMFMDLFNRAAAGGWGSPNFGPPYVITNGPPAEFFISLNQGRQRHNAVNVLHGIQSSLDHTDFDIVRNVQTTSAPVGGGTYFMEDRMRVSATQHVRIGYARTSANTFTLQIVYNDNGAELSSANITVPGVNASSNVSLRFRGCGTTLLAKAWLTGTLEPTQWDLSLLIPRIFSGIMDFRSIMVAPLVGFPIDVTWTNINVVVGQPIRLWRVTPDGTRTQVLGSPAFTDPFWPEVFPGMDTATFWDSTAPFNVDVYYELTSNCTDVVPLTSNTVNLDADGDGWIRDPYDPTKNFRIVMDGFFDDCLDEDVIVFSGLADREYENASGIFDHINGIRPITVSMNRKNYASVLQLTSFSLDDIDTLEDIFAPGRILLLSLPVSENYGWAHRTYGTDFITCFDITQSLIGIDQGVTTRVWTIPFRLSPEPADINEGSVGGNGIGGGGATFDALAASFLGTTFNTLTAGGFTFTQIAQGGMY